MSGQAWVVMVLTCGLVWGGFAVLLVHAARREAAKRRTPPSPGPPGQA